MELQNVVKTLEQFKAAAAEMAENVRELNALHVTRRTLNKNIAVKRVEVFTELQRTFKAAAELAADAEKLEKPEIARECVWECAYNAMLHACNFWTGKGKPAADFTGEVQDGATRTLFARWKKAYVQHSINPANFTRRIIAADNFADYQSSIKNAGKAAAAVVNHKAMADAAAESLVNVFKADADKAAADKAAAAAAENERVKAAAAAAADKAAADKAAADNSRRRIASAK